jgi:hypothetical protein
MPVIQNPITEGNLTFTFPPRAQASKYDDWSFYRSQFNTAFGGSKAVDIVFADSDAAWLIEVKDYRQHDRTKPQELGEEVAQKVRDSLAGLAAAAANANEPDEKRLAQRLLQKRCWRVVLHLEQPAKTSRLRPKAIDPAHVLKSMKKLLKPIDAHPHVVDRNNLHRDMSWTVI